jgi:hypothetical protein
VTGELLQVPAGSRITVELHAADATGVGTDAAVRLQVGTDSRPDCGTGRPAG